MWTNGSSRSIGTPAKARRTGNPSPSKPAGAVGTRMTGRPHGAAGAGAVTTGSVRGSATVMAGILRTSWSAPSNILHAQLFRGRGSRSVPAAGLAHEASDAQGEERDPGHGDPQAEHDADGDGRPA